MDSGIDVSTDNGGDEIRMNANPKVYMRMK
jgi:hypothetical protein